VTGGNHDAFLEVDPSRCKLISNAIVIINEAVTVAGLKIWGSPTTPLLGAAFGLSSPADRTRLYATIPDDVNILVTHGPPFGILDRSPGALHHAGCPQLLEAVTRIKPQLHIFGHVHGAHGTVSTEDTLYVNAALLGPDGDLDASPIVLRMPKV
jgi:Icc-related predicted phosphoesterase